MEAVGEAQVFAERTGLGTGAMEELIGEAFGPVAGGYSKRHAFPSFLLKKNPTDNPT
jgi:3-hydroxyisobutyrate dehydrogenase-like beta-hydroxyacid dehydrogenase